MLRPTDKSPYLSNFGQVRRVQASDRTATDDADSFDQIVPARNAFYEPARGCSTRTIDANPPELARCSARKIESPVLCESSIITPLEYSASCSAAQTVCTGAAPPSPIPLAPLYEKGDGDSMCP